jgi:hypothetical protein
MMKITKKQLAQIIKEEMTLGGSDDPSPFNALQTVSDRPSQFQGRSTAFSRLTDAGISKEVLQSAVESLPDEWESDKSAAVRHLQNKIVSSGDLLHLLHDMSERDIDPGYYEKNIEVPAGLEERRTRKKSKK